MNRSKLAIASAFEATGLSRRLLAFQGALLRPYARALNYHDVPSQLAPAFEAQLQLYARHFVSMNYDDLLSLQAGDWPYQKPGLLLSFDDGLRSHAEVVAPLLEKYEMTGWFMVPVGVLDDDLLALRLLQLEPGFDQPRQELPGELLVGDGGALAVLLPEDGDRLLQLAEGDGVVVDHGDHPVIDVVRYGDRPHPHVARPRLVAGGPLRGWRRGRRPRRAGAAPGQHGDGAATRFQGR